jgi:hypothetical protein
MYAVIFRHPRTVAGTIVGITVNNCSANFSIKNISTNSIRNGTNLDALVSHKSQNEVKRKHTTVEPKLQLLLKKNIYLRSLFTTHIVI